MAFRETYIMMDDFIGMQEVGLHYEGFVIGLGYAYVDSTTLVPPNMNGFLNRPNIPPNYNNFTLLIYQCVDNSPDVVELSMRGIAGDGTNVYTVQQSDTLTAIAQEHRVSVDDLVKWNKIDDANRIYAGQTLIVSEEANIFMGNNIATLNNFTNRNSVNYFASPNFCYKKNDAVYLAESRAREIQREEEWRAANDRTQFVDTDKRWNAATDFTNNYNRSRSIGSGFGNRAFYLKDDYNQTSLIDSKDNPLQLGEVVVTAKTTSNYSLKFADVIGPLAGLQYEWKADGPNSFDCSGAVVFGIRQTVNPNFPRITAHELYRDYTIPTDSLSRGSVIFYDYSGTGIINHVTTVLGEDSMLHPSSGAGVLQIRPLNHLNNTVGSNGAIYYRNLDWDKIIKAK